MATITESGRKYAPTQSHPWRRFFSVAMALALIVGGLWIAAALATHDRGDPSWNQSISAIAKNAMGMPGAQVSDALLQWLGLAAWLLPFAMIDWGVRLGLGRGLKRFWLKPIVLPVLVPATALAISILPRPASWPLEAGLGGAIGKLARDGFAHINVAPPLSAMAAAAVVALLLIYLTGRKFTSAGTVASEKRPYVRPGKIVPETPDEGDTVATAKPGLLARVALLASWRRRDRAWDDTARRHEPRLGAPPLVGEGGDDDADGIKLPARRAATVDMPRRAKSREKQRQALLDLGPAGEHLLPPLELLNEVPPSRFAQISEEALQQNARLLETVLADFGVQGQIVKVRPGPVVALYELEPAPGIKASRVIGLADDIARSMSALSARVAVIPGRNVIGIELPNARARNRLSARAVGVRGLRAHGGQAGACPRQGYRRHADHRRPRAHAASADRWHDGFGQVGRHQHDGAVDPLPDAAGSVQIHHDRPEDAGALGL